MKSKFGLIRKGLRLGKFVEHFKAAAQAWDAKQTAMDPFLRYCAIGRQLGYAGYLTIDNIHFLHATGIRSMEKSKAKKLVEAAYRFWFMGLAFNSIAGVYQLWRLRERSKRLDMKDGEGVVEAKRLEK